MTACAQQTYRIEFDQRHHIHTPLHASVAFMTCLLISSLSAGGQVETERDNCGGQGTTS
jgi:hypothetical protein